MPKQKTKTKTKVPAVRVALSTFDCDGSHSRVYRRLRGDEIGAFDPVRLDEYLPAGNTPLLDAAAEFVRDLDDLREDGVVTIGLLMDESYSMLGNREAVVEGVNEFVEGMRGVEADPAAGGKVLAVIATDGEENRSRHTSLEELRAMVAEREATGFTFIFIGADIDGWGAGLNLGLSGKATGQTITSDNSPRGTRQMFAALTNRGVGYVGDHGEYARTFSNNVALAADGSEVDLEAHATVTTPANLATGHWSAAEALEKAAESTRGSDAS